MGPGIASPLAITPDPATPIPEAVRRAAEAELRQVIMALTGQAELGPDEAAHEARKRTKKLRALLRLASRELGDEVYRRENRALRDAARQLGAVRDAAVLVESLDRPGVPSGGEFSPEAVAALRARLVAEHRALQGDAGEDEAQGRAATDFGHILARVARWPVRSKGRSEDFHQWRKQVKYLRQQFGLLRGPLARCS